MCAPVPLSLSFGCGLKKIPQTIGMDIQQLSGVDIVAPHGGTRRFLGDPTHKTAITCTTFNYFLPEYHYNFYGKARFRVEGIDLDLNGDSDSESRGGLLRWLWKRRM